MSEKSQTVETGISRRTVTKAMAWAAPAIAVAATVPTAAASCIPQLEIDKDLSCKNAPENAYKLYFKFVGDGCDLPETSNCVATITALKDKANNANGNIKTFWTGQIATPGPITVCDAASMGNYIWVTGTSECINGGAQFNIQISMPQITNEKGCLDIAC